MTLSNTLKSILVLAAFCAAGVSLASGQPATRTFEAEGISVRMPMSENGTISLRECKRCEFESIRVTPSTLYRYNNQPMTLSEFRAVIADLTLTSNPTVNVRRDEASNSVVAVFVIVR